MKIYHLRYQQELALPLQDAWDFFSSPYNLNEITPDFFQVEISSQVPPRIYGGLMIRYRMKAILGLPMAWLSEVSHCDEPRRFVYQQAVGPFKFWSHEVCLSETERGVILEDIVFYVIPFGILGPLLNACLIGNKLRQIFAARRQRLDEHWGIDDSSIASNPSRQ